MKLQNSWRKKEEKFLSLGLVNLHFKIPEDIVNELKSNAHQNKYLPMQGLDELRKSVANYTSVKKDYHYKSDNVIIGPGSKELMFLLHIIFDGEIILPAPSWVSYAPQAIIGRNKIQYFKQKEKITGFQLDLKLKKLF